MRYALFRGIIIRIIFATMQGSKQKLLTHFFKTIKNSAEIGIQMKQQT